ncbi:DcaP family trimeric outer membrane transporter [uncultured Abyssibacter sp.]|uniref:DcaP family trimeric outer membrane transporter n=1 Tax=uncultured Abyssibacter sp. TaxID=2320202 RepID=UPI0032B1789D
MTTLPQAPVRLAVCSVLLAASAGVSAQTTQVTTNDQFLPDDAKPAQKAPPHKSMTVGKTTVTVKGYIKLDAMVTDYDAYPTASLEPLGRDYYAGPRSVPLDDGSGGVTVYDMHAKQTRLIVGTETPLENGETVKTHLEVDFNNSDAGNETISNSYQPRLRQAFITYGNWLFGQTWSTFQNVGALPETLDFIGPAESTVFIRQPMVRYTAGNFQIAVENPESRIAGDTTTDDNTLPDVALRWNAGPLVLAGLIRSVESQDPAGVDDSAVGGGVSVSGKFKVGARDDLKFMATAGSGLGRYVGVISNFDANVDAGGDIDLIDSTAGYIAYRHFWTPKTRSSLVYGMFDGDGDVETASSVHVNLLHSVTPSLTTGIEFMHAEREMATGAEGAFDRVQFSAKYAY